MAETQLRRQLQTSRAEIAQCQRDNRQIIDSLSQRNAILVEKSELLRTQLVFAREQLDQKRCKTVDTGIESTCDDEAPSLVHLDQVNPDDHDAQQDYEEMEEIQKQHLDSLSSKELDSKLDSERESNLGTDDETSSSSSAYDQESLPRAPNLPSTIELLKHNKSLAVMLRQCREKVKRLEAQINEVTQKLQHAKAETNVAKGLELEALKTASLCKQELDVAKKSIVTLQQSLAALEAKNAECRSSLEETKRALEQQCRQTKSVERRLCRSEAEARVARAVSNDLMAERCDAQAFLSSSLRFVKTVLRAQNVEKDIKICRIGSKEGKEIKSGPGILLRSAAASRRISDVSDLTWEEREDVLRLLIMQINGTMLSNNERSRQETIDSLDENTREEQSSAEHDYLSQCSVLN